MKKNLKTLWPLAAAVVATTSFVSADTGSSSTSSTSAPAMNSTINPSGRPHSKGGADLFLTADWLIWQANETGLGFAVRTDTNSTSALGEGSVKSGEFAWQSGFRVGVGYNMGHDDWDLYLNWTWFQDSGTESVDADGVDDFIYPAVMHPGTALYSTEAESHMDLHLNVLDLEMGRWMKTSKWLTIRPHAGLRTAWVNQTNNIEYENLFFASTSTAAYNEYEVERECNYWGMGIRTGLDTQWGLGGGWSIYGNAAVSLLYGFFHVDHEEERTSTAGVETTLIDLSNSYRAGRAITDLQLGLRWDHMWHNDRYHFGIQAGWEHHMFFSQNQFMTFVDDINDGIFVQNQGDLELQGWTLAVRFDF